jgi:hypothetical protein
MSLWVLVLALLFGGGIFLYLKYANQTRIQDILQKGEVLAEQEDLDGLMDLSSPFSPVIVVDRQNLGPVPDDPRIIEKQLNFRCVKPGCFFRQRSIVACRRPHSR